MFGLVQLYLLWMTKKQKAEYNRQWRARNMAHLKRYAKKYKSEHPYCEKEYKQMLLWRKRNRKKYLRYQREYQRNYIKKWRKQYFELHPEKEQEYVDKRREKSRAYFQENKARIYVRHAKYRKKNRERINARRRELRAERKAATYGH